MGGEILPQRRKGREGAQRFLGEEENERVISGGLAFISLISAFLCDLRGFAVNSSFFIIQPAWKMREDAGILPCKSGFSP